MWTSGHQDTVVSHFAHGRCPPHSLVQAAARGRSKQPSAGWLSCGSRVSSGNTGNVSRGRGSGAGDISKSRIRVEERLTAEDVSAWGCIGSPAEWTPLKLSRWGDALCTSRGKQRHAQPSAQCVPGLGTGHGRRRHARLLPLPWLPRPCERDHPCVYTLTLPVFPAVETASPFATPAGKCWRRKPRGPETGVRRVLPDKPLQVRRAAAAGPRNHPPSSGQLSGCGADFWFSLGLSLFS